jgi:vacuolar-type H+-ATPase subunit E/Vma4
MEELQSTEILDREILEDARKKAYRILKTADETVKANAGVWEKKTGEMLDDLRKKYAGQRELAAAEIMARLPMDKRRAKAEKIESLLRSAVESWYAGLRRDRVLSILEKELAKRLAVCDDFFAAGGQPRVLIHKLDRDEAGTILKTVLPGQDCLVGETAAGDLYPAIILENGSARITASIYQSVDFFLHEKRAELAGALLGETVLNENFAAGGTP